MAAPRTVSAKLNQPGDYRSTYTVNDDILTAAAITLGRSRDVYDCSRILEQDTGRRSSCGGIKWQRQEPVL